MARVSRALGCVGLAVCMLAAGVATATAEPAGKPKPAKPKKADAKPAGDASSLTSDTWRSPGAPLDLHWHLLALPEYVVEIALSPLAVLVALTERYRLDRRVRESLQNDAGTIGVSPRVRLSTGDGFGAGASLWFKNLFGDEQRLSIGGLARVNGDVEADVEFRSSFASMEGRVVSARFLLERDKNLPYFGLGNDTTEVDRRVVEDEHVEAGVTVDLFGSGITTVRGTIDLSFLRERLSPGSDPSVMALDVGDSVRLPPAFGETRNYTQLSVSFGADTRDTIGRPTKGIKAEVIGTIATDLKADYAGVAGAAIVTAYLPVLPEHRALAVSTGVRSAKPLPDSIDVPFHLLTTLGRRDFLRGYLNGRFRDRMGWWASAEYSYPIYEYMTTGIQLHAVLFGDLGRVGGEVRELVSGNVRYSWGVGLRGVHDAVEAVSIVFGFSPEGVQFGLSAGDTF